MPKVIANKLTLETMPDTAENRIKTFRHEFEGKYKDYCQKYETITYGADYDVSKIELIKKYGLFTAHKKHIKEVRERQALRDLEKQTALENAVAAMSETQAKVLLLEVYKALNSYSHPEALGAIEQYKDDARYCDAYR